MNIDELIEAAKNALITEEQISNLKERLQEKSENCHIKEIYNSNNPLYQHLAKVTQKAESWSDWKKGILNSKVKTFDEEKERGITIKPFAYNSEDLKNFELGENVSEIVHNNRLQFLKEVDLAIKEYFLYKYNRDIDELIRISKNVNNFKIKDHFHKVSTLSEMKDCYFDGEYCYLTVSQGYGNGYIVKHWLEDVDENS